MKIYQNTLELVGNTPLVEFKNMKKDLSLKGRIIVKPEYLNPAGSAKDRIAKKMIESFEERGLLTKDSVIIEPTSGNTGIGLAMACAVRGYKCVIVMPDTMCKERILLMKAYGAEVVLSDGSLGMKGAIDKAEELHKQYKDSIIAGQFENPDNPKVHYESTGPEIYEDTDGLVDIFVSAVGTGGTISGTGKYLKEKNKDIKIVAVEPSGSPVLSKGVAGKHKIQGIGAGFVPDTLDTSVYDEVIAVSDEDAYYWANYTAKKEGMLVGISSGAALCAAVELAKRDENEGKLIVVLLPDTGDRYLSSGVFG